MPLTGAERADLIEGQQMTPQKTVPKLVRLPDVPTTYGWSRSHTYREAAKGNLRLVKVGKGTFLDSDSAAAYLASLPAMTPKNAA